MRLYYDQKGNWAGTQSDAKKAFGKVWWEIDVPTSKAEMLEFLNLHNCLRDPNLGSGEVILEAEQEMIDDRNHKSDEEQYWDNLETDVKSHSQSCSANTEYRDPSAYDVKDVVLNCDRKHLGSALGAIISRLHDELGDV